MSDPQTFAELLRAHGAAQLLQRWQSLRARHWDALVRLVLSVGPDDVDASGAVAWAAVSPRDLDQPVTREALAAWLARRPPAAAVQLLSMLLDPRDPRAVTWRDAIDLARERSPEAVADLVPAATIDPFDRARARYAGLALADALAARKRRAPDSQANAALESADGATLVRYLERAGDCLTAYEFGDLGRLLHEAPDLPAEVTAAYDKALAAIVPTLPKRSVDALFVWTHLASTAGLVAALRGPAKNLAVLERLVTLITAQGSPHGADALAQVVDHKKLGARAALGLASMGPVGAAALRRRLDAGALPHEAARRYAAALTALPTPPTSLWDGEWYGFPRFGHAPEGDLLTALRWPSAPAHAPTDVALLEAAVKQTPTRELLSATGWADLLQVAAIDPWFSDVRAAHATALRLGRLGHGNDHGALASAIDDLTWSGSITTSHPTSPWGYGFALLWAGGDEAVFRHAIARHTQLGANHWIGSLDRHFKHPLEEAKPPWGPQVGALLWFLNAKIDAGDELGPPRRLASLDAPAAQVTLTPDRVDLWIHATVEGASRVTLRLREGCEVTVDVAARTWEVKLPKGAKGAKGPTPSRAGERTLRLAVEAARDTMYVGIDGALVHGPFTKLPKKVAPVEVAATGDGALVTSLTLHEKVTVREAEAVGALVEAPDAPQGYAEVAGQGSAAAAHFLAVTARLGVAPWSKLAADALATMKGDAVAPWRDAPPLPRDGAATPAPEAAAAALPMQFTVRSFEDVARTFEAMALTGKRRSKAPPTLHRGPTQLGRHTFVSFNPKGAEEDWGARSAVPYPAVYLGEDGPETEELRYFIDQLCELPGLCRKGRGTWARGVYVVEPERFVVAALDVIPPDDGDDDGEVMSSVWAAAWKVTEGWAWALTSTSTDDLARLVGVRAFPPRVAWTSVDEVIVGNW